MERTYVRDLKPGKEFLIKGWVHDIRNLSNMSFLLLRDSSGIVQCVVKDKGSLKDVTLESVIEVQGKTKKADVKAELARHDLELEVSSLKLLNRAEDLPIHINEKTTKTELSKRLDYRSLDVRKPKIHAIFKIQSSIINSFREIPMMAA